MIGHLQSWWLSKCIFMKVFLLRNTESIKFSPRKTRSHVFIQANNIYCSKWHIQQAGHRKPLQYCEIRKSVMGCTNPQGPLSVFMSQKSHLMTNLLIFGQTLAASSQRGSMILLSKSLVLAFYISWVQRQKECRLFHLTKQQPDWNGLHTTSDCRFTVPWIDWPYSGASRWSHVKVLFL